MDSTEGRQIYEGHNSLSDELIERTHTPIIFSELKNGVLKAKSINPAFVEMFGYDLDELQSIDLVQLVHPDDQERISNYMLHVLNGHDAESTHTIRCMRKDGSVFWAKADNSVMKGEEGVLIAGTTIQDITDKILLQVQNETFINAAVSMAHDFQTPLTAILSNIQVALTFLEKGENEAAILRLERAMTSVYGASSRIKELGKVAELREGSMELDLKERQISDLELLILEQGSSYISAAESKGIVITPATNVLHDYYSIRVSYDKDRITNVVSNLLDNAMKYSERHPSNIEKGSIRITTFLEINNGHYVIKIEDNGIGIPAKDMDKIWRPFDRASNTKNYPGSGLGLPRCEQIIKAHGGKIDVESIEGQGTTFTVYLPISNSMQNP